MLWFVSTISGGGARGPLNVPLLVALGALFLVAMGYLWRKATTGDAKALAGLEQEFQRWSTQDTFPGAVERQYPSGNVATRDIERMQAAGYSIRSITWPRGSIIVVWQKR